MSLIIFFLSFFRRASNGFDAGPRSRGYGAAVRRVESQNNFLLLRKRLDKENQLHALMLSQRHFRRSK